jgi:GGDEF domain-containing protein
MLKRIEVWQADLHQKLEQYEAGQQFQQLAHKDSLTGLPNRLYFQGALQRYIGASVERHERWR